MEVFDKVLMREEINDWLKDNAYQIKDTLNSLSDKEHEEGVFKEEFNKLRLQEARRIVANDISMELGCPIDLVYELLDDAKLNRLLRS